MRLISCHFLVGAVALCGFAAPAQAQDDYAPPPVEFAVAGEAPPPAPLSAQTDLLEPVQNTPPERAPRRTRVDIGGYVEAHAGISAELGDSFGNDDTLTYTAVAAGIDGQVSTRRVAASFGYRYERRFELNGELPDSDVHSGIAQVRAQLVPNIVTVEAGGMATRTGGTGGAFGVTERDAGAQVYAGYVGPTVSTRAGNVAINAFYRLGYINVDDDSLSGVASPDGGFDSTVHMAGVSAGIAPGQGTPVGITVSAGHMSASTSVFDTEFESQFVRADALLPVNPALALSAGVGYSRGKVTQQDVLRDGSGTPIFDGAGNLFADPIAPRVTAYDVEGVYADAGFVWRPTPRAELQFRAGINDDGQPMVAGSAAFQVGRNFGFSFNLYDDDETYGTNLIRNLRNLPDEFKVERDPLSGGLSSGCTFSEDQPGRGVCLSPALQSITGASYRMRGGSALFSGNGRFWNWGGGISYARRDFHLPDDPIFANAYAPSDQDVALFVSGGRRLGRYASVGFDSYVSVFDSEDNDRDVTTIGGRVNFDRGFLMGRLELLVAAGLSHRSMFTADSLVADGIVGLRYNF